MTTSNLDILDIGAYRINGWIGWFHSASLSNVRLKSTFTLPDVCNLSYSKTAGAQTCNFYSLRQYSNILNQCDFMHNKARAVFIFFTQNAQPEKQLTQWIYTLSWPKVMKMIILFGMHIQPIQLNVIRKQKLIDINYTSLAIVEAEIWFKNTSILKIV